MTTQTILIILFSVLIVATIFILLVFKEKKSNTDSYKKAKSTQNRKRQTTSLGYTADEVRNKRYILTGYLGTQNRFYSNYVKNLNILLRQEERIRIQNIGEFDDRISITVDFHNLTVSQAGSLYNRLIKACNKDVVYLSAIHG
ncbi:MAG: hypothetical protein E7514_05210 [Ruminococcaceae bacterium]|nr:hypothetical protein [Oscillospiraceae bacterium]